MIEQYAILKRTLGAQGDALDSQRAILLQSFLAFRDNVKYLVGEIGSLLPDLTVHDISHLDALWRVVDQIAGHDYRLNPAEAFVLGGAILLHDAAHVVFAYEDRINGIKNTLEWRDLIAQKFDGNEPTNNSPAEKYALFQILRHLHAAQARKLPTMSWPSANSSEVLYLIEDHRLREYFGDVIGEIAESHHWSSQKVAAEFEERVLSAPPFLDSTWEVDALKIAFLLRTADAAHVDAERAPWFLFALRKPQGISEEHWKFQAKLGQPTRTSSAELKISAGSSFSIQEKDAWWLAYDTAKMIDRELRDANMILKEFQRQELAVTGVANITSPSTFSKNVKTNGWDPVHAEISIRNVSKVIENFGGAKLYGDKPELALRELIQNSMDAINALRKMSKIGETEGEIEVFLEKIDQDILLHVTDHGIGMSRFVLTEVLPDFGNSLWRSELVRSEIRGLSSSGFKSIGQFGIGFYSVFMIGKKVRVTTKRFQRANTDDRDQWILEFDNGISSRLTIRKPHLNEELDRAGTRVSVVLNENILKKMVRATNDLWSIEGLSEFGDPNNLKHSQSIGKIQTIDFSSVVSSLCSTSNTTVSVRVGKQATKKIILPHDWETISEEQLLERLSMQKYSYHKKNRGSILELKEPDGRLVGRVRYEPPFGGHAHLTYMGLYAGTFPELIGVLLGQNNNDLAREKSKPQASQSAWSDWAMRSLDQMIKFDYRLCIALHPLCPSRDLPIFEYAGDFLTEFQLRKRLFSVSELSVLAGRPEYENDDMAESKFDDEFILDDNILIYPNKNTLFSERLGFSPIDYSSRLEKILKDIWGSFSSDYEEQFVGEVMGDEIEREVLVYKISDAE